jgi:radical SAM protein with 4Fe4S-binding SPASM domain
MFHDIANMGVFRMVFTGGEPLLKEDLFGMIELSHDLGMLTFLETNGSLVNEENAKRLVEAGLQCINISINRWRAPFYDQFSGHKGLFNKVIKAFTILQNYPIERAVFTTINKMNIKEIPKIIDLAVHLDVQRIAFVHISPAGRAVSSPSLYPSPQEYMSVLTELEKKDREYPDLVIKYPNLPAYYFKKSIGLEAYNRIKTEEGYIELCTAGITSLVIDPAGNIKPCTVTSNHLLGNIKTDSLKEVWLHSPLLEKLRDYRKESEKPCGQCNFLFQCVAGHRCLDTQLESIVHDRGTKAAPLCEQCYSFIHNTPE